MGKKYDYDKLITSPKDMAARFQNMLVVKDVMESLKLDYWVFEGALLGWYRDGDFIDTDWDVDILMRAEDLVFKGGEIVCALCDAGFQAVLKQRVDRRKLGAERDGEAIAIIGYVLNTNYDLRVRVPYRFPARLFEPGTTIDFGGVSWPCPSPIEEYLELAYGDWTKRVIAGDPNKYRRGRDKFSKKVESKYDDWPGRKYHSKVFHGYDHLDGDAGMFFKGD